MQLVFIFIPLITLLIFVGLTRYFLLFPEKPVSFLGLRFQGAIHRYRHEWTTALATEAANQFAGISGLESHIIRPENFEKLKPVIEEHMDDFLRNRLKEQMPMISMFIGDKTISSLKTIFISEIEKLFPLVIGKFAGNLQKELPLKQIITEKLSQVSDNQLTDQLKRVLAKPFSRLYQLAIALGLLVAAIQWVLFYFLI